MKVILLTHAERRALVAAIAPEHRYIDQEGPTKGDIVILTRDRDLGESVHVRKGTIYTPVLRFRGGDE